ncbi:CDP-glycerol glycerophosphotransferase family protein [Methanobacterium alcaliphilum]|uniref:CDP-glycerol glycerophosphotransferase family protein n=1 Tax=Methanobacterium alcaliphilum TaxID=392018 RepID=UPI00200A2643|nr:CDP-glycerol glycerophosphotransferase family protein [Methanobacterium alcaliphilum]MCK9152239.1 CDP-glycerol glycerophosphotransferase family protein [Methanobacterium alcaliphilum]
MKLKKLKKKFHLYRKNAVLDNYYTDLPLEENLIFIESKNGNDIAGNIFYILKELSKKEYSTYKVVISLKSKLWDTKRVLLGNYGIFNIIFTETGTLEYYKYLYSAHYLFSDATLPPAFVKKKGQIYLNTWHGTPLKKLGKANAKRGYGLGNVQRNFVMADYLLYPNPFMQKTMISSFMLENLSKAMIMNEGYPRNSIFFDKNAVASLKSEMGIEDKQVIVYMPTWRGIYSDLDIKGQNQAVKKYLSKLDELLSEEQILYVKLHTVVKDQINYKEYNHIKPFPRDYETYHFLNSADCLITDYSSVFFDYACSGKKIILFAYDEEEYLKTVGTYFSLDELPFPQVYNVPDLIKEINTSKNYEDTPFLEKFCKYDNLDAAKNICEYLILNKENDIPLKNIKSNGKENVLIYTNSLNDNSLKKFFNKADFSKKNYFLTFRASKVKDNAERLYEISHKLNYIPLHDNLTVTIQDALAIKLFFKYNISSNKIKKQLDRFYKRNLNKYYPSIDFDQIIHITGHDKQIINLFARYPSQKTIFMHKDLIKKLKKEKITLSYYDQVVLLKRNLLEPALKVYPKKDKIIKLEDFIEKLSE